MNRLNRIVFVAIVSAMPACGPKAEIGAFASEPTGAGDPADEFFVSGFEVSNRKEIEALVVARGDVILKRDWESYVSLVHPDAVVEATATALDHRLALEVMLMKAYEAANGIIPEPSITAAEVKTFGIVREGDRLHALVGVEGGVPLLMSFRKHAGKWMLGIPPELIPFVERQPVELPPDVEKIPGAVAAAFHSYVKSDELLNDRSMIAYAETMHPDGLRELRGTIKAALGKLLEKEDDTDDPNPVWTAFLEMVNKPLVEFYAAYNEGVYRDMPSVDTRYFVLGGVESRTGIWIIVRREDSLSGFSRDSLVKAHMVKHEGVWKRDLGAEIGPDHVDVLAKTFSTMMAGPDGIFSSVAAIKEAGRGTAEDGSPYECMPGVNYMFRVVAASKSKKAGFERKSYVRDPADGKTYVDEDDIGLCDGHVRSVSLSEGSPRRISIGLTSSGQDSFALFTERFLNEPVAFLVGDEITSVPTVIDVIRGHTIPVNVPDGWSDDDIEKYMEALVKSSRGLRGFDPEALEE